MHVSFRQKKPFSIIQSPYSKPFVSNRKYNLSFPLLALVTFSDKTHARISPTLLLLPFTFRRYHILFKAISWTRTRIRRKKVRVYLQWILRIDLIRKRNTNNNRKKVQKAASKHAHIFIFEYLALTRVRNIS